mmetsp:Transcript_28491/g.53402  ORF Transcript_28491/g.53402 Transcript_28491/m.53402 type:complete len:258 (-) Transcript_28491:169-942(-)
MSALPIGIKFFLVSKHTGNTIQNNENHRPTAVNKNKGPWEAMEAKRLGNGTFVLKSLKTGNNLQCDAKGECVFTNGNEGLWEQWRIHRENGHYFFESIHTKKMLQVGNDGRCQCANGNKGLWEQLAIHKATIVPVETPVYIKAHTGKFIQSNGENKAHAQNSNKMQWEKIQFKHVQNDQYIITSLKDGNNLQCDPNGGICQFVNKNEGPWEKFRIEDHGDVFFLIAHTGNVVQVTNAGVVKAANRNKGPWEKLSFEL